MTLHGKNCQLAWLDHGYRLANYGNAYGSHKLQMSGGTAAADDVFANDQPAPSFYQQGYGYTANAQQRTESATAADDIHMSSAHQSYSYRPDTPSAPAVAPELDIWNTCCPSGKFSDAEGNAVTGISYYMIFLMWPKYRFQVISALWSDACDQKLDPVLCVTEAPLEIRECAEWQEIVQALYGDNMTGDSQQRDQEVNHDNCDRKNTGDGRAGSSSQPTNLTSPASSTTTPHATIPQRQNRQPPAGMAPYAADIRDVAHAQQVIFYPDPTEILPVLSGKLVEDDFEYVKSNIHEFASRLYEAVLTVGIPDPGGLNDEQLARFKTQQKKNLCRLHTQYIAGGSRKSLKDLRANCFLQVAAVIGVHEDGVPKVGVRHVDRESTCSARVDMVIEAAMDLKSTAIDISSGNGFKHKELARDPAAYRSGKMSFVRSNTTRNNTRIARQAASSTVTLASVPINNAIPSSGAVPVTDLPSTFTSPATSMRDVDFWVVPNTTTGPSATMPASPSSLQPPNDYFSQNTAASRSEGSGPLSYADRLSQTKRRGKKRSASNSTDDWLRHGDGKTSARQPKRTTKKFT